MPKTVLITGTSSGIGRASARHFQKMGWNVAASMRRPDKETELTALSNTLCLKLDVTKPEDFAPAIEAAIAKFGKIDVLVNNAGYGVTGPHEATKPEQIEEQFATNVFGPANLIRALLPHFRKNRSGLIINVSSVGGRIGLPLYSAYNASKWALEGFSEALQYEIAGAGIAIKLVEPGMIRTNFYGAADNVLDRAPEDYRSVVETIRRNMQAVREKGSSPEMVAETIFRAATDGRSRFRYPSGKDAERFLRLRSLMPDRWLMALVRAQILKTRQPTSATARS